MNNFNDMLSKAKKMQEKMKEIQENLKNIEVEGVSGGNIVRVVLKGDYEMKSIFIDQDAKKEKEEVVNDLIVAAIFEGPYENYSRNHAISLFVGASGSRVLARKRPV